LSKTFEFQLYRLHVGHLIQIPPSRVLMSDDLRTDHVKFESPSILTIFFARPLGGWASWAPLVYASGRMANNLDDICTGAVRSVVCARIATPVNLRIHVQMTGNLQASHGTFPVAKSPVIPGENIHIFFKSVTVFLVN